MLSPEIKKKIQGIIHEINSKISVVGLEIKMDADVLACKDSTKPVEKAAFDKMVSAMANKCLNSPLPNGVTSVHGGFSGKYLNCLVYECQSGYKVASDSKSCVKSGGEIEAEQEIISLPTNLILGW